MVKIMFFVAAVCCLPLKALCYTNVQQLVGLPLSPDVLTQMPTNNYTTPHQTLLSFHRASHSGDFTNVFNCCTVSCNYRDLQITNISEIAESVIVGFRAEMTNAVVSVLDSVSERIVSDDRYLAVLRYREDRAGHVMYSRLRFDVRKNAGAWKIEEWEDLLPGEDGE